MFKAIRLIMQEMDKVNMHYNVEDMEDVNILSAGYGIEMVLRLQLRYFLKMMTMMWLFVSMAFSTMWQKKEFQRL